jgi:hypothetical protein
MSTEAPAACLKGIVARESVQDGRYAFLAQCAVPVVGHLVSYEGWLDVD